MKTKPSKCTDGARPGGTAFRSSFTAVRQSCQRILALLLLALISTFANSALAQTTTGKVIIDNDCYRVVCPDDYVVYTCETVATPRLYNIEVIKKCPNALDLEVVCDPKLGTPLPIGNHTITCVVRLAGRIVGQCSFVIRVVRDTEPPKI
ncbi:MAG: hypothetical protein FJ405_00400, partial [Verrucomicrobia bacterium]|nr:hypothetical protein [Verrucomicrobiota bacterium]